MKITDGDAALIRLLLSEHPYIVGINKRLSLVEKLHSLEEARAVAFTAYSLVTKINNMKLEDDITIKLDIDSRYL